MAKTSKSGFHRPVAPRSRIDALLASGDFNGFIQGCYGVEIAVRNLRKEGTPKEIILKSVVIRQDETPIEQRQCPKLSDAVTN